MKKVQKLVESTPEKSEYYFDITLEDGHTSQIKIIKEMGEYVLVGDNRQHFCEAELYRILLKLGELNKKYGTEYYMMEDNECDMDCDCCDLSDNDSDDIDEEEDDGDY